MAKMWGRGPRRLKLRLARVEGALELEGVIHHHPFRTQTGASDASTHHGASGDWTADSLFLRPS